MAGGPGGPIVGRVRLRVAPDLSGFRKKVEKKLAGYDDYEMGVAPDLKDFKKQVGRATRGMKSSVAVGANTKGFREQMSMAMDRAKADKVYIQTGLATSRRALRRQLANIGKMIKSVGGNTAVIGGQIDWAMGGQASRRKLISWLDQVRNKAGDAGIVLKELDTTPTVASANNSIQEIERIIKGLKEIQGVRKALNRNAKNKSYDPQLHDEYLRLERMAKSLRGTNFSDSITDIDELTDRIRKFGARVDDSAAGADRLGKHLIRARRGIDELNAASQTAKLPFSVFNENAVIPETADRRLVRRVKDIGGKITQALAPIVRRINQTILTIGRVTHKVARGMVRPFVWAGRGMRASVRGVRQAVGTLGAEVKATAQLSGEMLGRMSRRVSRFADGARAASNAFYEMKAASMGIRTGSGRDTDLVTGLEGAGPRLERELTQAFDNSGRSVGRLQERTLGLGDTFRKLPGIADKAGTSSFKKFWSKFHQSGQKKFGLAPGAWLTGAIVSLIAPLSGLIGGALGALPALGLAAAAALGATVLGWEGIKEAAKAAAPAVEQAKEVLSGTFQDRLTPQFATLGEVLSQITPDLNNVANGMADFSQGFVNSLSSEAGIGNMKELLGNTAGLFSDLAPFAESFTDGLLIMGAAGSRAFEHLGESLNEFGDNFKQSMQEMADDGTLQNSIESTFDIIGSLGSNLGKVMRAGMEELPGITPALTDMLDSLGDNLERLMPLFGQVSVGVANILTGAFNVIGNVGSGIGIEIENMSNSLSEHAPNIEADSKRIGDSMNTLFPNENPDGSQRGFFERWLGAPLWTDQDSEMVGKALAGTADLSERFAPQLKQSADDFKQGWSDFFDFDTGAAIEVFKTPFLMFGEGISELVSPIFENLRTEFSAEKFSEAFSEAGAELGAAFEPMKEQFSTAFETLKTWVSEKWSEFWSADFSGGDTVAAGVGGGGGFSMPEIDFSGFIANLSSGWESVKATVSTWGSDLSTSISSGFDSAVSTVSSSMSSIGSSVSSGFESARSGAVSAVQGMVSEVSSGFSSIVSTVGSSMASAAASAASGAQSMASGFISGVQSMIGGAMAALGSLQSSIMGFFAGAGSWLVSSGAALVQGFAAGIRSMIGEVTSAASGIVSAARAFFPNSPAKKGPFSGRGWVDRSGIAIGMSFAKGMRSQVGAVEDAAAAVVGAAKWQFDGFADDLPRSMENYQRAMILDPVMEANAKKIHDYRKREADNAEKLNERIAKINEGKSKDDKKAEQVAKAQEDAAKRSGESYEKLLESLETPEYGDINRSFQSYWIDGSKDVLRKGLVAAIENADLAGRIRDISMAGVREGRRVFGTHPIFDQAEAAVNAEHFSRILQKVIEDSGIAEIPINFALSNLDQLKSDIGMGDGVISRAIDAAISTDPAETDARWARQNPVEIHYHVADMEEAIRLENERERKGMIKYKN